MSSNSRNENQSYPFNGIQGFYPHCNSDQQPPDSYNSSHVMGIGISGPGTHLEDTTTSVAHSNVKTSGRGRRKQRKKMENVMGEAFKMEHSDNPNANVENLNEIISISNLQENLPESLYQAAVIENEHQQNEEKNVSVFSEMLEQVLSYKKMLLMQSPEVIEFLKKTPSTDNGK